MRSYPVKKIIYYSLSVFAVIICSFYILMSLSDNSPADSITLSNTVSSDEINRVLIVNSYHKGLSWTDSITSVIEERLSGIKHTEVFIEYLDAKRLNIDSYEKELYGLLAARYRRMKFKTVIVTDNNALSFTVKYRTKLFPETPVIFCGINNFTDNLIDTSGWYTGVVEKTDVLATFNVMKMINPRLRSCIVICDNTPTGLAEYSAAQRVLGNEKDGVKVIYWINLNTDVLIKRLGELNSRDDAVLLTVFNRDGEGLYYDYDESSRLVTENTGAQVYGLWELYIGKGVIGGCVVNARDQGQAASEMALRIIGGEDVKKIPIKRDSPNSMMFDYAVMSRFGIGSSRLPEGSVILNMPQSVIKDNIGIIAAALLIIISQGAALLLLFRIFMKTRKKALKDLKESEENYRVLVDNSFDIIYKVNSERRITFASPSWTVLLGHDVSEVKGRLYTDFVHPDDCAACEEFIRSVISSNRRQSGVDYRVLHRDGSWRMHTSSAVPVNDENGVFTAFVGIAKDITDRKAAEVEVKKLLTEKELLLKEVHHRIKNNMSTISSLLYLHSGTIKNHSASTALIDARNRVQSMMVIYDKLYRSEDFRSISARDYLSSLITGASSTFPAAVKIDIRMEIQDLELDSEVMFPVGIIVNELLSNTCKYAFPASKRGAIKLIFKRESDNLIKLEYSDDGAGFPEDAVSGNSSGFGMNLIRILTVQLNGRLEVLNEDGAKSIITFPYDRSITQAAGS